MKLISLLYSLIIILLVTSCDMIENQPYAARITGKTDLNTRYVNQLRKSGLTLPFRFAFITDTQGSLNEMKQAINIIKDRGDIDFIVHGGDLTDFGIVKEFIWARDIMEEAGIPYITVIGNHDCLGNGNDTFDYIFGPENFSFNVGPVHFLCLNTIALEYDYSRPVPDLNFIEGDAHAVAETNRQHPDSITHSVVVMHSRPYDEQFNNNVAKPFNYYIAQLPGMDVSESKTDTCDKGFCLNGHNHATAVSDIFDNGILYYQCADMGKRTFFIFTVTPEGYDYETVDF